MKEARGRPRGGRGGADAAAGAVARADAILRPRGLAARRAQARGVARSLHRRCPLLHAPPQERAAPRGAPQADAARRSCDPRGGQALSRDAGGPARDRDGLGRGSPVAHPSPHRQSRGGAAGERRGRGQDDTLVIAIGSVTNDFGTPGVAEHAVPLETPAQAARFNRRLVNACIRAQTQDGPVRPGQLHVAIVGAGATGAELAAELHRTAREVVAYGLDRIDPQRDIRIVLIEAADRILPALPERISEATHRLLDQMGVEVHTGAKVTEVTADGLQLADGSFIASELVVWAAGVKAPEVLRHLDGLAVNRINQLVVEPTLQTTRDPDIFAIGDCAACPRRGEPTPV